MIINALICDDEQKYIDQVLRCLEEYCFDNNLLFNADSFTDGVQAIKSQKTYNIAFLDIEVGNISGLDIAKSLKNKNKNVIIFFITAYEKYIDDAMNLFALRFIKKPIDNARLYSGLDKAISLINEDEISFYLKDSGTIINVMAKEIMYIEIGDHKTIVVTENKSYYSKEKLDYWEQKLTNICFCRPHKSFIINMEYIDKYQRNEVTLKKGKIIPIAYRKQKEFGKTFWNYLRRRK